MLAAFLGGFGLCASLILAIGAQNTFVLIQAIRKNHHYLVAGICSFLDALLIAAGVLGVGALIASNPILRIGTGLAGALVLLRFGYKALRAAFIPQSLEVSSDQPSTGLVKKTVLATLAVSLLNPHVYLDTVVMLGAISGNYAGNNRYFFGLGATTAAFCWFFSLAKCGTLLAPLFAKPRSWQVLNIIVCATVWFIGFRLGSTAYYDLIQTYPSSFLFSYLQ